MVRVQDGAKVEVVSKLSSTFEFEFFEIKNIVHFL